MKITVNLNYFSKNKDLSPDKPKAYDFTVNFHWVFANQTTYPQQPFDELVACKY